MEETTTQTEQLVEREKIENTPFTLIKQDGKYFLTMGNYKMTEPVKSRDETLEKLKNEKWNLILNMIIVIAETLIKNDENKNKNNKTENN